MRLVNLKWQELLTLADHLNSRQVFEGYALAKLYVFFSCTGKVCVIFRLVHIIEIALSVDILFL